MQYLLVEHLKKNKENQEHDDGNVQVINNGYSS